MAKEVIVLTVTADTFGQTVVNYLLWLPVPNGQQIALGTNVQSAWIGASSAENVAIQQGTVIEEAYQVKYPNTYSEVTIEADLVARYASRLAVFQARVNPLAFYGIYYDSATGWSAT